MNGLPSAPWLDVVGREALGLVQLGGLQHPQGGGAATGAATAAAEVRDDLNILLVETKVVLGFKIGGDVYLCGHCSSL